MQKKLGPALVAGGLLIVVTGTAFTLMQPKLYDATARIQIVYPENTKERYDEATFAALTRTQIELIGSNPIACTVLNNLNLQQVWGEKINQDNSPLTRDDALRVLRAGFSVTAVPGTVGLVSIRMRSEDPEEAARIANEVAAAYRDVLRSKPQQGGSYEMKVVSPAEPATRPVSPNLFLNVMICAIAGGALMLVGRIIAGRPVTAPTPGSTRDHPPSTW